MTDDDIAALINDTAGQHWGDEAHFQRFAVALEKRFELAAMPAIKLAMQAERQNGAAAEREACAALLEANGMRCGEESLSRLILETNAAAIRARTP
jgi:hypothetical protein